jgi:DNA-binding HxlR family transcriptional regulator
MPARRATTKRYQCPIELTLDVMGGKWKPRILWELRGGPKRFNELLHAVPDIAHKVLTQQLRALEHDGLIARRAFDDGGRRVEYALSDLGRTLRPSLDALAKWAKDHHREVHAALDWPP